MAFNQLEIGFIGDKGAEIEQAHHLARDALLRVFDKIGYPRHHFPGQGNAVSEHRLDLAQWIGHIGTRIEKLHWIGPIAIRAIALRTGRRGQFLDPDPLQIACGRRSIGNSRFRHHIGGIKGADRTALDDVRIKWFIASRRRFALAQGLQDADLVGAFGASRRHNYGLLLAHLMRIHTYPYA